MGTYTVTLDATSTHVYTVNARTPEEAESIAEQLLEDGDCGNQTALHIELSEAVPDEVEN